MYFSMIGQRNLYIMNIKDQIALWLWCRMALSPYHKEPPAKHNRYSFFKYYAPESGIATLEKCTRRWSSPKSLNDPFDLQFHPNFEDMDYEQARKIAIEKHKRIFSDEPLEYIYPGYLRLREAYTKNPEKCLALLKNEDFIRQMTNAQIEGANNALRNWKESEKDFINYCDSLSVFCMSESHDDILMWSHYAKNHTGVVIEILSIKGINSPIILAQKVKYKEEFPLIGWSVLDPFVCPEKRYASIFETIALTKSLSWDYEREWRIIDSMRKKGELFEDCSFDRREVGKIYLGCKISTENRAQIIELTKNYPNAKVLQMRKHPTKFALEWEEI